MDKGSNGPDEIVSKVDLEKLIQKFRPNNPDALEVYLEDVWKDLSERDSKNGLGLTKKIFLKYYDLPLIINERLFKVLDVNNHSSLTEDDFVTGLLNLFLGDYKALVKIMFNMYDYNRDGKISKKDVKIVFNYIPLKQNEIYERYKIKYEGDNINERKESMNEINKVLDKIFEEDYIDEDYFKYSIENINSDLFIFLLVFLYEKRPFNDDTINHYKNLPKKNGNKFKRTTTMSNSVGLKLVVSPTIKSKFGPAAQVTLKEGGQYSKFKSNSSNLIKLKFGGNSNNHLKAFGSGLKRVKTFNIKKIKTIVDEQDEEYEDEQSSKKKNQNIAKEKSNFDEEENEEEDIDKKNIKYEGYLSKIRKDGEMKKLYFKLLYHDLYFFKSKEDTEHGGVHNLCDVFIKEGNPYNYNGKTLYCFSIIYPEKERKYFTEDKQDHQNWVKYLRKATDYEDLYKSYEMKDVIGQGRYGTIRVGYHKIKKRFVAIKIINKKSISKSDMENIRNQIDILKIATDEFVLKLLDIIENESY